VVSVMMIVIVPKLLEIFSDKSTLPVSTRALMVVSNIFSGYWFLMIIIVV
jgi:type II secretory pathway component PulF